MCMLVETGAFSNFIHLACRSAGAGAEAARHHACHATTPAASRSSQPSQEPHHCHCTHCTGHCTGHCTHSTHSTACAATVLCAVCCAVCCGVERNTRLPPQRRNRPFREGEGTAAAGAVRFATTPSTQLMDRMNSVATHVAGASAAGAGAAAVASGGGFEVVDESFVDAGGTTIAAKQLRNVATGEFVEVLLDAPGKAGATGGLFLRSKRSGELRAVCPHRAEVMGTVMAPFANRVRRGSYVFGGTTHQLNDGTSHATHGLLMHKPQLDVAASSATVRACCSVLSGVGGGGGLG
jgi:hypothetical protein